MSINSRSGLDDWTNRNLGQVRRYGNVVPLKVDRFKPKVDWPLVILAALCFVAAGYWAIALVVSA